MADFSSLDPRASSPRISSAINRARKPADRDNGTGIPPEVREKMFNPRVVPDLIPKSCGYLSFDCLASPIAESLLRFLISGIAVHADQLLRAAPGALPRRSNTGSPRYPSQQSSERVHAGRSRSPPSPRSVPSGHCAVYEQWPVHAFGDTSCGRCGPWFPAKMAAMGTVNMNAQREQNQVGCGTTRRGALSSGCWQFAVVRPAPSRRTRLT